MANAAFHLSVRGAALVKAFESCKQPVGGGQFKAYLDPIGVLTIGWGHTNHHGRTFDARTIWTQAECDAAFNEDMRGFEAAVKRLVKVDLTQYQFDALVSFAYNCGEGNLAKSSLLRRLNAGDFAGAAREFARWNKAGGRVLNGLTRRRASEALLFQGIPDNNYDGRPDRVFETEIMAQAVDAPGAEKPLLNSKIAMSAAVSELAPGADVLNTVNEASAQVSMLKANAEQIGVFDVLARAASMPRFWIAIAVMVVLALIIYWRWRDHQ